MGLEPEELDGYMATVRCKVCRLGVLTFIEVDYQTGEEEVCLPEGWVELSVGREEGELQGRFLCSSLNCQEAALNKLTPDD